MEYYRAESDVFMRLEPGEYLMKSLIELADKEEVDFATVVSGVGMVEGLEMGWFCVNDNDYDTYKVAGTFDLASVSGNISLFEGGKKAHIHIIANRPDFSTIAGHLIDCRCHVTMEICLRLFQDSGLERKQEDGRPATFITKN